MGKEDEKPIVYEVLFSGTTKGKDGDNVVVGPARVQAGNRMTAVVMASLEKIEDLKKVKPTTIRVKVRDF